MARGTQLLTLITMLRAELGRSTSPALGVADVPTLKQALNRAYETLYKKDWQHLRREFAKITLNAGQRYYDLPTLLDSDRVEKAVVWWNGEPYPLCKGIGFEHFAAYDSTIDERNSPAARWDIRFTGTVEQIEIWPVPADSQQTLQFIGKSKFTRLVNDIDTCRLDDNLVVLHAAARLAVARKSNDASLFAADAKELLEELLANAGDTDEPANMAGTMREPDVYTQVVVRVR
jgi:hypothetical protein